MRAWSGLLGVLGVATCACVDATLTSICPAVCRDSTCAEDILCQSNAECPLAADCIRGTCRAAHSTDYSEAALVDGFGVAEFELAREEVEDAPRFELQPPPSSLWINCALFASAPQFTSDSGVGDTVLLRISNASRSIARERLFRTTAASESPRYWLTLAEMSEPVRGECDSGSTSPDAGKREHLPVAFLAVGCWAFDRTRVIAATRLAPIAVSELPEGHTDLTADCREANEGHWCNGARELGRCASGFCADPSDADYRTPLAVARCDRPGMALDGVSCSPTAQGTYGVCWEGECRARCRELADCSALSSEGARVSNCYRDGGYTGVCR